MPDHINPSKASFAGFNAVKRKGPVQMLNLIKLRNQARYEDGRNSSGADAYQAYAQASGPIFRDLGGKIIWSGRPEAMVIGPETGEEWDIAFIAEYPDMAAFATMIRDPQYQTSTHHRTAAVQNSRLIRMEPQPSGALFG